MTSLQFQRRSRLVSFARDGETYRSHVTTIQCLNRRLFEIECEPVVRPVSDSFNVSDAFLVNSDLYRSQKGAEPRARPYYNELCHIARRIAERRELDRNCLKATYPALRDFYWTPQPRDNPLSYGAQLRPPRFSASEAAQLQALSADLGVVFKQQDALQQKLRRNDEEQLAVQRQLRAAPPKRAASAAPAPSSSKLFQSGPKPRKYESLVKSPAKSTQQNSQLSGSAVSALALSGRSASTGVVMARPFIDRRPHREEFKNSVQ